MDATLKVRVDVAEPLLEQFERDLMLERDPTGLSLRADVGTGERAVSVQFPDGIEFYHFGNARFAKPVEISTSNATDSEWFLIHMNLSTVKQQKHVAGQQIDFQMLLPIGLLIYGPGLEITTLIPPGVDTEVASIRFERATLSAYFDNEDRCFDTRKNLICEDFDHSLQSALQSAIGTIDDRMLCHSHVLAFMSRLFAKLRSHEDLGDTRHLRDTDIDGLFRAAAQLRDPLSETAPSVDELANIANMSATKFKTCFRQLFGNPPKQYRNKIRMEFARDTLRAGQRTPSEISYLLGYSHPSNFTTAYKKYFGKLPSAIRDG